MHLLLEYCMVRMFIGRIFILPQDGPLDSGNRSTPSSDTASRSPPRAALVHDCGEAALSVVEACRVIARRVGLARASYTEFSSCRAALLVVTTQCLTQAQHTDRFRQALRDGVVMLKDMSSGSQSWHSEASLIEAFERAIASMNTRHAGAAGAGAGAGEEEEESDYTKFKKWEQMMQKQPATADSTASMVAADENVVPLGGQSWRPAETTWRDDNGLMPSCTPFFGVDGNFASFPESLDELPSFLDNNF